MKYNSNGKLKIMQITDIQEVPNISKDTLALLEAAVETEKPDLVVYTGDQIKGYGVTYKGKGKELEKEFDDIWLILAILCSTCNNWNKNEWHYRLCSICNYRRSD